MMYNSVRRSVLSFLCLEKEPGEQKRLEAFIKGLVLMYLLILLYFYLSFTDVAGRSLVYMYNDLNVMEIHSRLLRYSKSICNKAYFMDIKGSEGAFYDSQTHTVGSLQFHSYNRFNNQPYVSNGYIGSRIPNLGHGFSYDTSPQLDTDSGTLNGWPLFNKRYSGAFAAGFYDAQPYVNATNFPELYDNGYESVISAIPQWTILEVSVEVNGKHFELNPSKATYSENEIKFYNQNLSYATGAVTTKYLWLDLLEIEYRVIAHRKFVNLGLVDLKIVNVSPQTLEINVTDILDHRTSQRCSMVELGTDKDGIYSAFRPVGVDSDLGVIFSAFTSSYNSKAARSSNRKEMSIHSTITFQLHPFDEIVVSKRAGIVTNSSLDSQFSSIAELIERARGEALWGLDKADLVEEHNDFMLSSKKSVGAIKFVDEPVLDLVSEASLYHLFANTRSSMQGVSAALPVSGLSSDSYGGMVFWDSDFWMFNGMLPFMPENAKSIINYRMHTLEQAKLNAGYNKAGAVYPWTSGRFGNCTSTGPCFDYEYHINVAIAMSAWNYYISGMGDDYFLKHTALPLINETASFLASYVHFNESLSLFETHNLTDPDEYANHIDNGAYTNAAISWLMKVAIIVHEHLGIEAPLSYKKISNKMYIPMTGTSEEIVLEYSGMNSKIQIKQADVIMITYPLNNEMISRHSSLSNLVYYSTAQSSEGPAMTYPIFSIASAKLLGTGCSAQSHLYKSVLPFVRGPFIQFSEQSNDNYEENGGTHPAFPFLTGHGGFLQSIVYGLLGISYSYVIDTHHKIKRVLELRPKYYPCFDGGFEIDSLKFFNQSFKMTLNETSFTVVNQGAISAGNDDAVNLHIFYGKNESKFVEVRHGNSLSFPIINLPPVDEDSMTECGKAKITAISEGLSGDVTESINDGDITTYWQSKTLSAKVLVDLKQPRNVSSFVINWGMKPARNLNISAVGADFEKEFENSVDIIGKVKFQELSPVFIDEKTFSEEEVFTLISSANISISAPYNASDYEDVKLQHRFNISTIHLNQKFLARYLLFHLVDTHDPDNSTGPRVNELTIF